MHQGQTATNGRRFTEHVQGFLSLWYWKCVAFHDQRLHFGLWCDIFSFGESVLAVEASQLHDIRRFFLFDDLFGCR